MNFDLFSESEMGVEDKLLDEAPSKASPREIVSSLEASQTPAFQSGFFSQGQIKLSELSVYNWGSFHGLHTASIHPDGTLVTGDNGAGKSTFIDGLMALLLPAGKASFNVAAAQGDRSDRSLLSYMRGSFGTAHDGGATRVKSKREKGVVTGLRALYRAEDGTCITLAALFWTTSSSHAMSDVKRIYLVAKRDLQLKELLDAFGDGNVRHLKQWIRQDPMITDCDNHFSDYQELYRKLLYMENKNAPALLSRALGLKKIDDLTQLIRELVLEPSRVREDARRVVEEFADLVATHEQLVDAKAQYDHLKQLPELAKKIEQATEKLQALQLEKAHLPIYFAEALGALWAEKLMKIEQDLAALSDALKQAENEEQSAQETVDRRYESYLKLGGGQIEALQKEVERAAEKLEEVVQVASKYQADCELLELEPVLNERTFISHQHLAKEKLSNLHGEKKQREEAFVEVSVQWSKQKEQLNEIEEEIKAIEAHPDSNIDVKYQKLRDELSQGLSIDKEQLVFVGELLDVKEEDKAWQGAIERALGGLRTTLLVPKKHYSMVTRWLNAKHTGLHVRVQVVLEKESGFVEFKENGFLRKLVWKEHPYRDWLKQHLKRFDLICVSGTDELDVTPFSMTQAGLVHLEKGRFEKKDRFRVNDRRTWCLGFSNRARLQLLNTDKVNLERQIEEQHLEVSKAREALDRISESEKIWERLLTYAWHQMDVPTWKNRLQILQQDLKGLQKAGGDLEQAKQRWEAAKEHLQAARKQKEVFLGQQGALNNQKAQAEQEVKRFQALAEKGMPEQIRERLFIRVGQVSLEEAERQIEVDKILEQALERERTVLKSAETRANGIMSSFKGRDKWQPLTVEWASGLEGLPDYLAHFAYIEKEGLPALIEQFQARLNKHATQSLARIKTKLESEREDILERIETINQVLERTEFKQGSHLKLGSKREKYPHVIAFERKVKEALSQATSEDHEARFKLLAEVVEILDKASASGTAQNKESLRLLDPRYQMSFFAEEIDSETLKVRDVLESSSGKSGGEKESFAGTIVAASLAYVLTPEGADRPVYCTVFLDEAFSNTAEAVSRRVLRVFKALHIHVNLITPYKNLNLARESASSLLIAERDPERHESQLCEVTWEEIDRRMAEQKGEGSKKAALDEIEWV